MSEADTNPGSMPGPIPRTIRFSLNGRDVSVPDVHTHHDAIDVLNRLDLRGARESCGQGLCGCCTMMVDGRAVSGCLQLGVLLDGTSVETIEGLANGETLDPIQQAFIDHGAFQCGFCTPGMILMTRHLLDRNPDPSDDEIRDFLSGNLCRCGAYPEILRAVRAAADRRREAA